MTQRSPVSVRLESFEGPLDLLLHLIQSHELDINKVSIGKITDQYLTYIKYMVSVNFDVASDFLLMAATLLLWKSKSLLPQDENNAQNQGADEDLGPTPEDLIRQLLEHQRFLKAGDDLHQLPRKNEDFFVRANLKPPIEKVWKEISLSDLILSYQDMLALSRRRKKVLKKETVSISEKIQELNAKLELGKITELRDLMGFAPDRPEIVVTFLAALETARLKKLRIYQNLTYDPIYVELLEHLSNLEISLAQGFDAPAADGTMAMKAPAAEPAPETTHSPDSLDTTVPLELISASAPASLSTSASEENV